MAYELPGFLEERVASMVNMDNVRADFMCRPSVMLHVVPKKDGDMWCALLGDNLMEGVAGFGDSPNEAMWSFDKAWYEKARAKNPASPAKEGVSVSTVPYKCPVCEGSGQTIQQFIGSGTADYPHPAKCSACGGRGIVWNEPLGIRVVEPSKAAEGEPEGGEE